ncbi:MAG: hypothetical protein ACKPFA_38690, partial [Dolichospermum sp.]
MSDIELHNVAKLITKGTTPSSIGCNFTTSGINFSSVSLSICSNIKSFKYFESFILSDFTKLIPDVVKLQPMEDE